ncbi:poly-gamma-glutamate hydrolase family protein [Scytonema sp. PCC 10023]|uniref:poly-gamma-glutamate hydrolase family protein n=1 Tax=Scytonema sp. PCC 10023 TaxID=1680591 RepID=UPI0039C71CDA
MSMKIFRSGLTFRVNAIRKSIGIFVSTIPVGILLVLMSFAVLPGYASADVFDCFDGKKCVNALSTSVDCKQPEDYEITRPNAPSSRTDVTVLSFHGGNIEAETSAISNKLATMYGWDRYDLNGHVKTNQCGSLGQNSFQILHITSTHFDDPEALALVNAHPKSVAIHGYSKSRTDSNPNYSQGTICVGGASKAQISAFINSLNSNKSVFESSLEGYPLIPINAPSVNEPLKNLPENQKPACYDLKGEDKNNIVNRNASTKGLQLELSWDMRKDLTNDSAKFDSLRSVIYGAIRYAMSVTP